MAVAKRICTTEGCTKSGKYLGRVWLGQENDRDKWEYLGYFCTKAERRAAQEARKRERAERVESSELPPSERVTCEQYADEYIDRMESGRLLTKSGRCFKASSIDTARGQLQRFKTDFGGRTLGSIERHEAIRWAEKHGRKQSVLQSVVTLFGLAVDEELLERNPFRGLTRKPKGRASDRPPSEDEMLLLLAACDALGDYAPRMRALLTFAAHTITRPGELFALDWDTGIDLLAGEVHVRQRLYRGQLDLPKSNAARTVALTPPARDALLSLPERSGSVFRNKTGGRLTAPTLSAYWGRVLARAGFEHDFYLATKHYGVHYMKVSLGLSSSDIAAQAGWSEASVEEMVRTYAHTEVGALDRIKAAYAGNVVPLRPITDAPTDAPSARFAS